MLRWRFATLLLGLLSLLALIPLYGWSPLFRAPLLHLWSQSADPLLTSLAVSVTVLGTTLLLGTPAAWAAARRRGLLRLLWEAAWMLLLVTPPLVLGLLLALTFGPYSWAGARLQALGLSGTNSPLALFLATFFESSPYYLLGALSAFAQLPRGLEDMAATCGLGPWRTFLRVALPEAAPALTMAAAMAWARAMGAFGAVIVVAYHPYGLPLWTWLELETNGLPAALAVAALLVLVAVPWPLLAWGWTRGA